MLTAPSNPGLSALSCLFVPPFLSHASIWPSATFWWPLCPGQFNSPGAQSQAPCYISWTASFQVPLCILLAPIAAAGALSHSLALLSPLLSASPPQAGQLSIWAKDQFTHKKCGFSCQAQLSLPLQMLLPRPEQVGMKSHLQVLPLQCPASSQGLAAGTARQRQQPGLPAPAAPQLQLQQLVLSSSCPVMHSESLIPAHRSPGSPPAWQEATGHFPQPTLPHSLQSLTQGCACCTATAGQPPHRAAPASLPAQLPLTAQAALSAPRPPHAHKSSLPDMPGDNRPNACHNSHLLPYTAALLPSQALPNTSASLATDSSFQAQQEPLGSLAFASPSNPP